VSRPSSFVRHLAGAYALLLSYASLHPLSGWHDSGASPLAFLTAAWPRYYTYFDLAANVAVYVPLGLLLVPAMRQVLNPAAAFIVSIAAAISLSLGLETGQSFLPSRVPSNVDLGCNALGALIGGLLGWRYGGLFAEGGPLARWRDRRILQGGIGDLGLVLCSVWLLTQLNPENLALGTGDLRGLLGLEAPVQYSARTFYSVELSIAMLGVVAAGSIGWLSMREPSIWLVATLLFSAIAARALAWAVLVEPSAWLRWLTPGNRIGFLAGLIALAGTLYFPRRIHVPVAVLALFALTVLVNLAPDYPYRHEALARWRQGHFLNFNGLTALASSVWPFFALAWLLALVGRRD
jgi:VanZ family protein